MNAPGGGPTLRPGDVTIPYTPIKSMGKELGIMFAFISFSFITMGLYWVIWWAVQRRIDAKEEARREALSERVRERNAEKLKRGSNNTTSTHDHDPSYGGLGLDRHTRNGTSANGFIFGDLRENMIV